MKTEPVEIYSDKTSAAIMRHPGRKHPGILIQGDDLNLLCMIADGLCAGLEPKVDAATYRELDHLRRWIDTVAACYPERSPTDVRLSVNAALGLLLSTVWWSKELRSTPGVREKLYILVRATLAEPLG